MASHTIKRKIARRNALKRGHADVRAMEDGPNTIGALHDRLAHALQMVEAAADSVGRDALVSDAMKLMMTAIINGETLADTVMKRVSSIGLLCAECRYAVHICQCHTGRYRAIVGQSYQTLSGDMITVTGRADTLWGYETLICSDGRHRYDRSYRHEDAGRVTGTDHDYSCPNNIKWDAFTTVSVEEG